MALTVNFCAPVTRGEFDLDIRLVKANRSSQHWSVEMTQDKAGVVTLATAVFAERRPSWSHQPAAFPQATAFEQTLPYAKIAMPWVKQYDFRFVEGEPKIRLFDRRPSRPARFQNSGSATACRARSTCCR